MFRFFARTFFHIHCINQSSFLFILNQPLLLLILPLLFLLNFLAFISEENKEEELQKYFEVKY
jgi:hypothetical protein